MRYIRQYVQQTVQAESSSEFDELVNAIYKKAASSGKDPEIHFFEGRGFCATVKYFMSTDIPESVSEKYEMEGMSRMCCDCPLYSPSEDKRVRYTRCSHSAFKVTADCKACDYFDSEFMEGGHGTN